MTTVRNVSIVQKLVLASVLFCLMTLALGAYALHRSDGARRLANVTGVQAVARVQLLMAMKAPLAVSEVEERRLRHSNDAAARADLVKSLDSERGRYQLAAGATRKRYGLCKARFRIALPACSKHRRVTSAPWTTCRPRYRRLNRPGFRRCSTTWRRRVLRRIAPSTTS